MGREEDDRYWIIARVEKRIGKLNQKISSYL
jgi:hypothetical protein